MLNSLTPRFHPRFPQRPVLNCRRMGQVPRLAGKWQEVEMSYVTRQ